VRPYLQHHPLLRVHKRRLRRGDPKQPCVKRFDPGEEARKARTGAVRHPGGAPVHVPARVGHGGAGVDQWRRRSDQRWRRLRQALHDVVDGDRLLVRRGATRLQGALRRRKRRRRGVGTVGDCLGGGVQLLLDEAGHGPGGGVVEDKRAGQRQPKRPPQLVAQLHSACRGGGGKVQQRVGFIQGCSRAV